MHTTFFFLQPHLLGANEGQNGCQSYLLIQPESWLGVGCFAYITFYVS